MKFSLFLLLVFSCVAAVIIAGCKSDSSSPTASTPVDANVAAVQSLAVHSDSLNSFNQSDSATIDDKGAQPEEYDMSTTGITKVSSTGDSVTYGRKMYWSLSTRSYSTVVLGDTAAVVTVTHSVPGVFLVVTFKNSAIDTSYSKTFTEALKRSFYFKRIARKASADSNWVPVAVSIGYGYSKPDSGLGFKIARVEFSGDYDTSASDPLNTWFLLGHPFRSGVPFVQVHDTVRVTVWVESSDSVAEVAHIRHGVTPHAVGSMRQKMYLVVDSAVAGGYVRVYTRAFAVHDFVKLFPLDFLRRYSAFVDVISHESIWAPKAPFKNEYWAFPYIAYK